MIKLKRINAINMKVADISRSAEWYKTHFGFELAYKVENGQVIMAGDIELVLSPQEIDDAPLADPQTERCIHTLAFEVGREEFDKVKDEFADAGELIDCEQAEFHSLITNDPDGYCVEIFYNRET